MAQEALTNVLKHAGPVRRVDVEIRYGDDAVELVVRDDGQGSRAPGTAAARGWSACASGSRIHDGTLDAGPREGGGFQVAGGR